ncbi:hypothetical protein RvY_04888 [Ramazzottius varieornatus]|uniref:DDRGK domain-containing protein 1 n=1 Tax=Ramazzottius varieornatus TaxID=947166 RepID=A0A1D1UYT0_RAMVA|nr:hypothetical protein RvY_04888 [Ramazzottius varieornatus]
MDTTSIILALGFAVFACFAYFLSRKQKAKVTSGQTDNADEAEVARRVRQLPDIDHENRVAGGRRIVRNRQRPRRPAAEEGSGSDFDVEDEDELPDAALGENIGAKKRRKLEMKAEKRAQRQAELAEREEKKERQARLDEERKQKEAVEKMNEEERLEEERKEQEEKERREHEEYMKLKATFEIEAEGEEPPEEGENLLQQFVDFIKATKVVLLEELAAHFKLRTQECIDRVQKLQSEGLLTGVIDDRGKFIYISMDELEAVAKFVKQRGRVTIAELAESSNQLIRLQTTEVKV